MEGEWVNATLGEVCEFRAGTVFKPEFQGKTSGDYPFIKVSDMNLPANAVRIQTSSNWVSADDLAALKAKPFPAGTVVFAKIGEALRHNRFRKVVRETLIDNNMMGAVPNRSRIDPTFLYYALSQFDFSEIAQGTALPYLTVASLSALTLAIPPGKEQRAIAHILGTLDDKIELNRRMNETLEAIARAIFKSWFVDFDPVRAKASGEPPESICRRLGLTPDLLALFPDRLVDSELGEIPEGWGVGRLDEEFDLTMGQSPPGETYNEVGNGIPFYQGRADFESRFPKRRVYCSAPKKLAKRGDTLISVRAPVGAINMAAEDCAIGRGVAAARHKSGSRSYTYQFMHSLEAVFSRFEAEGTVFGSISKSDFHGIPCLVPPAQVVASFETILVPLDDLIEIAAFESRTLAALRDTLLPKLISGELRVPLEGAA